MRVKLSNFLKLWYLRCAKYIEVSGAIVKCDENTHPQHTQMYFNLIVGAQSLQNKVQAMITIYKEPLF